MGYCQGEYICFHQGIVLDWSYARGCKCHSIVLIPKIVNPSKLTGFKPISLCNVIYKVMSKCLVNRLCPILDDIISPAQSVFVPGRMVIDNVMIAFDCIHHVKQKKIPPKVCMLINLIYLNHMIGLTGTS